MSNRHLAVLLYGLHVADLEQTRGGQHLLDYRSDPGATPISLTMPLAGGPFAQRVVEPFLDGLLPERQAAREAMSREFDVSARNPFALRLPDAMTDAFVAEAERGEPEVGELRARMLDPIARSCKVLRGQRARQGRAPDHDAGSDQ